MKKVLMLVAVLAVTGIASAELLSNPGFESGDLTGWGAWGAGYGYGASWAFTVEQTVVNDAGAAYSGDNYLKLGTSNATTYTTSWGYTEVHQGGIAATAGLEYKLSAYIDPGANWEQALFKLVFKDGGGSNLLVQETGYWVGPYGWQYVEHTLTAPAGTATVRAQITNGTVLWPGDSAFGVDDVSLVPEPATMALLGLGGLFLRRRKK